MEKVLFWALGGIVLIAALLLGKWFSDEAKKIKIQGKPMYHAYFTKPGVLVLISFSLIFLYYFLV